jgi:hypothetical protein
MSGHAHDHLAPGCREERVGSRTTVAAIAGAGAAGQLIGAALAAQSVLRATAF